MIKLPVKTHHAIAVVIDADGSEILKCWTGPRGELNEMENASEVADALNARPAMRAALECLLDAHVSHLRGNGYSRDAIDEIPCVRLAVEALTETKGN